MTAHKKPDRPTKRHGAKPTKSAPKSKRVFVPDSQRETLKKALSIDSAFAMPSSPRQADIRSHALLAQKTAIEAARLTKQAVTEAHTVGQLLIAEESWLGSQLAMREIALAKKEGRLSGKNASALAEFGERLARKNWSKEFGIHFDSKYAEALPRELADRFIRLAKRHAQTGQKDQEAFTFYDDPNLLRSGLLALNIFPAKQHEPIEGDAKPPRLAIYLALINRLIAWARETKLTTESATALLIDFAPVIAFVDRLKSKAAKNADRQ